METKTINIDGEVLKVTTENSHHFQGDVIITDPCYFIPDNVWSELCKIWFDDRKSTAFTEVGTIYYRGAVVLYTSTAFGDGSYNVSGTDGIVQPNFGVDAGMMAVITKEDYAKISKEDLTDSLYALVEDFGGEITADGEGNFTGDLTVYTDDSQTNDDWEDEEDDDYDNEDDDYWSDNHDGDRW